VILENYAAHKHEKVRAWLERHLHWMFHFTPTSSPWLNAVEGLFAKLARRRLKRGVIHHREKAPHQKQCDLFGIMLLPFFQCFRDFGEAAGNVTRDFRCLLYRIEAVRIVPDQTQAFAEKIGAPA
jgi:hypothetical protein